MLMNSYEHDKRSLPRCQAVATRNTMGCMDTLGSYIKQRRELLGISQTDLAANLDMPRAHLAQIESRKIALPNAGLRRRLAAVLGVRHVDLLVAAGELDVTEVSCPIPP